MENLCSTDVWIRILCFSISLYRQLLHCLKLLKIGKETKSKKNNLLSTLKGKVLPYISYIGICHPIGYGFCVVLVWKWVYTLPILVWNWVWFLRELRECMNVFIVSTPNEWERKRNMRIWNGLEELFCLRSNLSNDNQEPITCSEQLPCTCVTAFSQTSLFLERFWREFRIL